MTFYTQITRTERKFLLKTLDLSLKVLSLFKGDKTVWSVNEIADHLGENNTKIYRIVETFTKIII